MKAFMSICCRICGDGVVDVSKVTLSKVTLYTRRQIMLDITTKPPLLSLFASMPLAF